MLGLCIDSKRKIYVIKLVFKKLALGKCNNETRETTHTNVNAQMVLHSVTKTYTLATSSKTKNKGRCNNYPDVFLSGHFDARDALFLTI